MLKPPLKMIFACSKNGVIGRDGSMPWYLPEDLAHFKKSTVGAPVIMGRKTWESLPARFKPLPERLNIVLTRTEAWDVEGTVHATTPEEAVEIAGKSEPNAIWVIGGAQIYETMLPLADFVYVTEINEFFDGDTFAPELPAEEWYKEKASKMLTSSTGLEYRFLIYKRIQNTESE